MQKAHSQLPRRPLVQCAGYHTYAIASGCVFWPLRLYLYQNFVCLFVYL